MATRPTFEVGDSTVPVRFRWRTQKLPNGQPISPDTKISVRYKTDEPGSVWNDIDLTGDLATGLDAEVDLPNGANVEFRYVLTMPDGTTQLYPAGGPDKNLKGVVNDQGLDVQKGTHSGGGQDKNVEKRGGRANRGEAAERESVDPQDIRALIPRHVEAVLSGSFEKQGAEKLDIALRALHREIAGNPDIKEEQIEPAVLSAVTKFIRKDRRVPRVAKQLFPEGDEPESYSELGERIELAISRYREEVYDRILQDDDARKALGITNNEYDEKDPFKDPKLNEFFERSTKVRCLGHMVSGMQKAFEGITAVAPTDPELAKSRDDLRNEVLATMPEEAKKNWAIKLWEKLPGDKLGATADVLLKVGFWQIAALSSWMLGGVEGLTGITAKDIVQLMKNGEFLAFVKKLLKNNFVGNAILSKKSFMGALATRAGETFLRMIPGVNLMFSGSGVSEMGPFKDVSGVSNPSIQNRLPARRGNGEQFIIKACDKAL